MEKYLEHIKVFKALGDPKRAMIVDMLSCGELCACKILEKFEMSQSTLSHHMKILCECGLVKGREEGKWTYYSLDADTVSETQQFFHDITSDKENCICRENTDCRKGCNKNE
ncbi:ArsR family transcriptional regulator [Caproiciproducens sp. NJN-50]|uniref:ArsR/SmtB family transcription factor n=1 Tax=Acutalibacteraceae TaxID=3082771 RepID=UPI000FFE246D|nr:MULTISPECIES: metalloregulator ArsR/SmtB family transcription factor [Acutalibacteraceae]QAT48776.1 ArsR family transcriptional regulator [Caproiciproducens sp. NJN-50]